MGRSSREQADRNRAQIVATACELFRQHGAETVSIADIMAAAGLTPGGFYKHFESKDALIEEAFTLAFEQSSDSWQQLLERADTGAGLQALVQRYIKQRPGGRACPMLSFASQVSNLPPDCASALAYGKGADVLFNQFCDQARMLDADSVGAERSEDAALLFAAMIGTGLLARTLGDTPWIRSMQSAVLKALPNTTGVGP